MIYVICALCLWLGVSAVFALALCRASKKNPFEVQS